MSVPLFWFLREEIDIAYEFDQVLAQDAGLGVLNDQDLMTAWHHLRDTSGDLDAPWPAHFPHPVAGLPEWSFAPDFWAFGMYKFASRRFRDVLAQPGEVVQFLPFDLVRASTAARRQDYHWMRVLARQDGLELAHCDCEIEERPHAVTGKPVRSLYNINLLALRNNLVPRTDIFRLGECRTFILVTDAVAGRVLHAGCTGMEFSDPANLQGGKRIERYRTAHGMAERRIGFLD